MQKLVYLNEFVEIVNDDLLQQRINNFGYCDKIIVKHPSMGIVIAPKNHVFVMHRSKEQFENRSYTCIYTDEQRIAVNRFKARQLAYRSPISGTRGLSGTVGGVRHAQGTFLNLLISGRRDSLYSILKPYDTNRYIGIELELCSQLRERSFLTLLSKHPLARFVSVANDGSIEPNNCGGDCDCGAYDDEDHGDDCEIFNTDLAMELRILCKESELSDVADMITDFTKSAHCYVNQTCGLHVHIDMRTRDVEESYEKLFDKLDDMYNMVSSDRANNTYCKRNKRRYFDDHDSLEDRYFAINTRSYEEHSTLEVRLHHATLKGDDIKNWVTFLIDSVDAVANNNASNEAVAV